MKRISRVQILFTFLPSMSMLAMVAAAKIFLHKSIGSLTRDPIASAGMHPLTGVLSNLGIILWAAAASVCLFSTILLRKLKPHTVNWFLFCSALLSAYLLFDDFFQFHETLAGMYLGVNEKLVLAVLGVSVMLYVYIFRKVILRTQWEMLLLAVSFLVISAATDAVLEPLVLWRLGDWNYILEDGPKWLGIACWCSYYLCTSYHFLMNAYTERLSGRQEPTGMLALSQG